MGHSNDDNQTFKVIANIDINNSVTWSTGWLVKFNPQKTAVKIFSSRPRQIDCTITSTFRDIFIEPVNSHRHLRFNV